MCKDCKNKNCNKCLPDIVREENPCVGTPCDFTLDAKCIFINTDLECLQREDENVPFTLDEFIALIDQWTCGQFPQLPVGLKNFYVDSRNEDDGDGSILNPFKTWDLCKAAIIGTGTADNPQYKNVTAIVYAGVYTTSDNMWVNTTNWECAESTIMNFTGSGYFLDSSAAPSSTFGVCKLTGGLSFRTATGGFINNEGTTVSTGSKMIVAEFYEALGSTTGQGVVPLIHIARTGGSSHHPPALYIKLKPGGRILSAVADSISIGSASWCYIDLNYGQLGYGVDPMTNNVTGVSTGRALNYNAGTTTGTSYQNIFSLRNGDVYSVQSQSITEFTGEFSRISLVDLNSVSGKYSSPMPDHFAIINPMTPKSYTSNGDHAFTMKNITLTKHHFSTRSEQAPLNVITLGTDKTIFKYLHMHNCVLGRDMTIDPLIELGKEHTDLLPIGAYNVINGVVTQTELPVYADNTAATIAGRHKGTIYRTPTGQQMIVY